ncbi:vitellogenin 3, phosvitinless [Stigmatopora nigra]
MRGLVLCCLVALATCQSLRYDLSLNPKKTYEYKYEGLANFGLGMPNMAESGAKITCKVKIVGVSAETFLLQVSDLAFEEFNGFPGKHSFMAAPKVTQRIAGQLVKPFMFDFTAGHVGNIHASAEVSDTVVNIIRGILSFFHITVKTTQTFYELEEAGIHGMCQSNYAIEKNKATNDMTITQVVDVTNCREKAERYSGMATAVLDDISKKRGDSIVSTMRYVYTIKPSVEGGLISRAHGLEQQHFSPFNVKGGSFKLKATKEIVLLDVRETPSAVNSGSLKNRGNIVYKFVEAGAGIPIVMQNVDDPVAKAVEMIKHLADANKYQIASASTEEVMKLYQLLRLVPYEDLEVMWKQLGANDEYRRWFLDTIVEVNDARILKFLQTRFQNGDLSAFEAFQTLLLGFNHLEPTTELIEMAKMFLNLPYSRSNKFVWHTVALSYGSLVYKHCAYYTPCPVSAVQPLLDFAMDSLKNNNEDDIVLALKALGNAGHPSSIKTIMRFLPGVSANPVVLPPRVLSAAVQSLRLIAARDPHSVQDIAMSLYLQKDLPADLRMLAIMILFDTKPPMALVSTVTAHLQEEKDLHVVSFVYTYLRSMAKSRTPDNQYLSTACNVAVKILAPKFGRLTYRFSKAMRLDWFDDDLRLGMAGEFFMLRNATEMIPTEIMMKGKLYFIGRILQLMEVGVRADGIKDIIGAIASQLKGDISDFQTFYRQFLNWESQNSAKPLLNFYSRASGQEWLFADINKEFIRNIINAVGPLTGKGSSVWTIIQNLQKGISWHWTKSFLIFETRYFQASTLGLPIEISKYYHALSDITVNAKTSLNPPVTDSLGQLLNSEISLDTDGFVGCTKDLWLSYGINTELFQSGVEFKSKIPYSVPWKLNTRVNIKERKFQLDFPLSKNEIELIAVSSDVYAISRNIGAPTLPKMTPMMPKAIDSNNEIVRKGPTVVKIEFDEEIQRPNNWHPMSKMCSEKNIYGAVFCVESELRRTYYHEEYPLYYLLGYSNVALKVVPVQGTKAVDKIRFEVNAGSTQYPTIRLSKEGQIFSDSESTETDVNVSPPGMASNSTPEAIFNIRALALSGNLKPEGYETAVFYTPTSSLKNTQIIVSQVGDNTNWKMCMDLEQQARAEAKAHLRWGAECQSFDMSLRADTVRLPGSKPTLRAKVHWDKIPETMAEFFRGIKTYIPGMAFLLGFNQQLEKNPIQEVAASIVVSSPDSLDVRIQLPEYTVYRQSIPVPLPRGSLQELQLNARNTTM